MRPRRASSIMRAYDVGTAGDPRRAMEEGTHMDAPMQTIADAVRRRRTSRKRFLAEAAGLTTAVVAGALARPAEAAVLHEGPTYAAAGGGGRSYAVGRFGLEIDGTIVHVSELAGGNITAEVVAESAVSTFVPKHLGFPKYEEFAVRLGTNMGSAVRSWISDAWEGKLVQKEGAVLTLDLNSKVTRRIEFTSAFITEVGMPPADGASKDAAFITLKFAGLGYVDGATGADSKGTVNTKTTAWSQANFRFELDNLPTNRVSRIDPFAVNMGFTPAPIEPVDPDAPPVFISDPGAVLAFPPINFPGLRVTFSTIDAQKWRAWHRSSVVLGSVDERNGKIVYLDPTFKKTLGTVELYGVGIYGLQDLPPDAQATVARTQAQLYCERMVFDFSSSPA